MHFHSFGHAQFARVTLTPQITAAVVLRYYRACWQKINMGHLGGITTRRTPLIRPGAAALPRHPGVNRVVPPVHLYVRGGFQSCSLQRRIPGDVFVKGGFRVRGVGKPRDQRKGRG